MLCSFNAYFQGCRPDHGRWQCVGVRGPQSNCLTCFSSQSVCGHGYALAFFWLMQNAHAHSGAMDTHLLASAACSEHLSGAAWLHPGGSRLVFWLPSQLWPWCQPAAGPRGTCPSTGHPESIHRQERRQTSRGREKEKELFVVAEVKESRTCARTHTCLASMALSRAIVAVSSARAAAMLLLARLVLRALISMPRLPRRCAASFRTFSFLAVSDSILEEKHRHTQVPNMNGKLRNGDAATARIRGELHLRQPRLCVANVGPGPGDGLLG